MKKLLLSGITLVCAFSAAAMDEQKFNKNEDGPNLSLAAAQPLKFVINQETGFIEDAPDSHLISTFHSAVRRVHTLYDVLKKEIEEEFRSVDETRQTFQEGSIEHRGAELHQKGLVKKIEKYTKQQSETLKLELFLQKILHVIYKPDSSRSFAMGFNCAVPDFEILTAEPFKDLKLDFSYSGGPDGIEEIGKSCFAINLKGSIPMDMHHELNTIFQYNQSHYKLQSVQGDIFEKAAMIYDITTKAQILDPQRRLYLQYTIVAAEREGKDVCVTLNEQIDALIYKAEHKIIPGLEVKYWAAKIIMSFQEEASRHRPQVGVALD